MAVLATLGIAVDITSGLRIGKFPCLPTSLAVRHLYHMKPSLALLLLGRNNIFLLWLPEHAILLQTNLVNRSFKQCEHTHPLLPGGLWEVFT
jgi:hypothetical protein